MSFLQQQMNPKSLYQIIIGVFFLVAGTGKVLDSLGFGELIYSYGLKEFYYFAPVLAVLEVTVGLALLLFIQSKVFLRIAFGLLLVFTIAFGYAYIYQGVENCGCLGTTLDTSVPPSISFLRNFLLLSINLYLIYTPDATENHLPKWRAYTFLGVNLVCLFIAFYTFLVPTYEPKKQHVLEGKEIRETPLKNIVQTHQDSTYLIYVFTYQCPHCKTALKYLKDYQNKGLVDKILCISSETSEEIKTNFTKTVEFDFPNREIDVQRFLVFGEQVPLIFYVKNNKIQKSKIGRLPSSFAFKKLYLEKI